MGLYLVLADREMRKRQEDGISIGSCCEVEEPVESWVRSMEVALM